MKVINKSNDEFKKHDIGLDSINKLKQVCYETKNIDILGQNDIHWMKLHKNEVLNLHRELLSEGNAESGDAACNLELIGEKYFGDLDLI